jgi:hypothetical protein
MWLWIAKEGYVLKRPLPERKSREALLASLMADAILAEGDTAELLIPAAVDEARAIMREQRQLTSPPNTTSHSRLHLSYYSPLLCHHLLRLRQLPSRVTTFAIGTPITRHSSSSLARASLRSGSD